MIRAATPSDVPTIHALIRELARYEKLEHEVVATEEQIRTSLFGPEAPQAEVLVVEAPVQVAREHVRSPVLEAPVQVAREHVRSPVLQAPEAKRVVGFALFFHNYSTFLGRRGLYLEDLFVLPEYRRRGYGTALLRALARIAVDRACGRFEWAVLDWNEPAIRFYRSLGAQQLEEWRICRVTGPALERLAVLGEPGEG
jgi:GNAT superfamily N-acetyltransferase